MEKDHFIVSYLKPSMSGLEKSFTLELPKIPGLKKLGEFIVQGASAETVSTNIIAKYSSEREGIRLVEVYKNTEEKAKEIFIRLVGTMSLVKKGYPFIFLDAAVTNINFATGQHEGLTTRVAIHLPQSDGHSRDLFFEALNNQAESAGLSYSIRTIDSMPDFWGPLWSTHQQGIAFFTA